jgi:hypothetical protein
LHRQSVSTEALGLHRNLVSLSLFSRQPATAALNLRGSPNEPDHLSYRSYRRDHGSSIAPWLALKEAAMTLQDSGPEPSVHSTTIITDSSSNVDWPAIIAGAVIASAISSVLFAFGTGIGLSITSPYPSENVSPAVFAIVLSLWILLVTIMSFLAGGYFTGLLMRRRGLSDHELEMRDGMHGLLTWAIAVILGVLIAGWTVAGAARTGTMAASTAATAAATGNSSAASYYADMLLRSNNPTSVAPAETDARRGEASRILLRNASGEISDADSTYLAQLVTNQTGLAPAEATSRVETVTGEFRSAIAALQVAAEKARKFALILAFAVAGTIAIGAAAAWWGALQGGDHRDSAVDLRKHIGWRRVRELRRTS